MLTHLIILVAIYATLTLATDLLAGVGGLVIVSMAALYGVGAYTAALSRTYLPWPAPLIASALLASVTGIVLALLTKRLVDDDLVMATFGLQVIVTEALTNLEGITGGTFGITGILPPHWLSAPQHPQRFAMLAMLILISALTVALLYSRSPAARRLRIARDDEVLAASLAIDVTRTRVLAFAIAGGLAGVAGAVYAYYISYIDPRSFSFTQSVAVLSMLILGGADSRKGAVLGALCFVVIPELLRYLPITTAAAANLRQIIYGVVLLVMPWTRPAGLLGRATIGGRR